MDTEAAGHNDGGPGPATFGQLLRSRRRQRGLSLSEFAQLVYFNRGHISKVENGKRPPSVKLARACDRALQTGATFTRIAAALEAATRQQQGWIRPAQLPAAQRHFVGRHRQLDELDEALHRDLHSVAVPVAVIEGQPGVGKTALAMHWAHRAVNDGEFCDGQLFVDLGGPAPATAAEPAGVLDTLLRSLGVPPEQVPPELDQKSATFRSILHGREVLLLLDNAAHAGQVYPLLPGWAGCAVIVTSRIGVPGLTRLAGAVRLTVPVLDRTESVRLLRSTIDGEAGWADPTDLALVADRCGHLPLALVLAAENLGPHLHQSAAALDMVLKPEHAPLDLAADGVSVRRVFDTSYRLLDPPTSRLFRLLGLHAGERISVALAATVADVSQSEAADLLHNIARAHLLQRHDERDYRMPDLLRRYAADLTGREDPESERDRAKARLAALYLR